MSQPTKMSTMRSFGAVAIVFAIFAQFAMLTHSVLVEHSLGEHCETCIAQDRTDDDAAVASPDFWARQVVQSVLRFEPVAAFTARTTSAIHNRGPPLL